MVNEYPQRTERDFTESWRAEFSAEKSIQRIMAAIQRIEQVLRPNQEYKITEKGVTTDNIETATKRVTERKSLDWSIDFKVFTRLLQEYGKQNPQALEELFCDQLYHGLPHAEELSRIAASHYQLEFFQQAATPEQSAEFVRNIQEAATQFIETFRTYNPNVLQQTPIEQQVISSESEWESFLQEVAKKNNRQARNMNFGIGTGAFEKEGIDKLRMVHSPLVNKHLLVQTPDFAMDLVAHTIMPELTSTSSSVKSTAHAL
ncbi:MAG TPA: hypothetical protein VJB65_01970, partial [Patescibacteria group bacterium]|nr:hypothetical protein [Patescibacteria group bacterium]